MATILIVEDEESVAKLMTFCLRNAGHTPIVATDGQAALCAARARPDLILLDLGLPDLSGAELLRRWKRQPETAQIPVVIISGAVDAAAVVARCGPRAVAAILRKPVVFPEVRAVVDAVLHAPAPGTEWPGPSTREARVQLLYRLITEGSNTLVRQVCLRLEADRRRAAGPPPGPAPSWPEIVRLARWEGLLSESEIDVLTPGTAVLAAAR